MAFGASTTHAQTTLSQLAARSTSCSTAGVEALSSQLAEYQRCLAPDAFVRFDDISGVTLTSSRVHPYVQASARTAIAQAVRTYGSLSINSAFRTVADQYLLQQGGNCSVVAAPGRSNHQSGRAIDVQNWSAAKSALQSAGCVWYGSSDSVHYDCPGTDRRSDSILAFQALWNRNNPADLIDEDGIYGTQTATRLGRAPVAGFAVSGCGCEVGCDGNVVVDASCGRTDCGADTCEVGVCVDSVTPDPVTPDPIDGGVADGGVSIGTCADISVGRVCLNELQVGTCEDGELVFVETCAGTCQGIAPSAVCGEFTDPVGDGGVIVSDSTLQDGGPSGYLVSDGCAAGGSGSASWLGVLMLLGLVRRRRV